MMKIKFIATFPGKHYSLYGKTFLQKSEQILAKLNKGKNAELIMSISIDNLALINETEIHNFKYLKIVDYQPDTYGRSEFVNNVKVYDETDLDIAGDVSKQIIRWSFKGMMQIHHLLQTHSEFDFIIYIDADTVFTKNICLDELLSLLPAEEQILSAVFRGDINKYTETGWIAWNTKHRNFKNWVNLYSDGWNNHIYEKLSAYHDCAIFDWVCAEFPKSDFKNLSGGGDHGFNSGELGKYLDHKKGIRKHFGFSYENITLLDNKIGSLLYKLTFGFYIKLRKILRKVK